LLILPISAIRALWVIVLRKCLESAFEGRTMTGMFAKKAGSVNKHLSTGNRQVGGETAPESDPALLIYMLAMTLCQGLNFCRGGYTTRYIFA
jgi:hypothetical protein